MTVHVHMSKEQQREMIRLFSLLTIFVFGRITCQTPSLENCLIITWLLIGRKSSPNGH